MASGVVNKAFEDRESSFSKTGRDTGRMIEIMIFVMFEDAKDVESNNNFDVGTGTTHIKETNKRIRWNLVFNVLLVTIVPLPLWLSIVSEDIAMMILPGIQILFMTCWVTVSVLSWVTYGYLFQAKHKVFPKNSNQSHLVVVSSYREPVALLISTVESIEVQYSAESNITLNISFEERTPEKEEKIMRLEQRFSKQFSRLFFTIHPYNLPGEIPGKCSNANYGIRTSLARLECFGLDTDNIIITTCDADTKFHPQYFNALSEKFSGLEDPHLSVFQSPLLYNWRLGVNILNKLTTLLELIASSL